MSAAVCVRVLNTYVSVFKMERVAMCYDVSPNTVESPQYLFGSAPGFFSFCWDDVSVKAESNLPTDMLVYENTQEVVQVDWKQ